MADLQYVLRYAVILAGAFVSLHDFSLAQTCSGHSDCPGVGGCCCTHDTPYEVMIEQCSRDVSEPGARRRRRDIHALNTCINEARPHSNPAGEIPGACECKEGYKAAAPSGSCVEMDRVEAEQIPGAAALCAAVTDLYPTTNVNDGTVTQNYAPILICGRLTSRAKFQIGTNYVVAGAGAAPRSRRAVQIMQSFMKLAAVLILRLLISQNERAVTSGARVILVMQNANIASTLMTHQHSAPVLGGGYVLLRSSKPIATE